MRRQRALQRRRVDTYGGHSASPYPPAAPNFCSTGPTMVLVAALVTLAAAASAAAGADDVAAATINADRSPETLLGDDAPFFGSTPELGDRRTLAKKRGCNPKKNTSCCRTPRRTRPAPRRAARAVRQLPCLRPRASRPPPARPPAPP